MADLAASLTTLSKQLGQIASRIKQPNVEGAFESLESALSQAAEAFSGSWLGYHSRVYYKNLVPPPPGAHFSPEWGLSRMSISGSRGEWTEYTYSDVYDRLKSQTNGLGLDDLIELAHSVDVELSNLQEELISILSAICEGTDDEYLRNLKDKSQKTRLRNVKEFVECFQPKGQLFSRDTIALLNGLQTPPHIFLFSQVQAVKNRRETADALSRFAAQAAAHLERRQSARRDARPLGDRVFIGHGRSHVWKDLKDFIQDRLQLPWDEFNRVSVAGVTNITRLSQMLEQSAIAFLIMTAEDEQANGKIHARQNVIHEAGLFQGKLGFSRAIVLLEEGCEEFSNIQGLGHIRFPSGRISAVFEELRLVLEREGLLPERD